PVTLPILGAENIRPSHLTLDPGTYPYCLSGMKRQLARVKAELRSDVKQSGSCRPNGHAEIIRCPISVYRQNGSMEGERVFMRCACVQHAPFPRSGRSLHPHEQFLPER